MSQLDFLKEVCICNSVTMKDAILCIKKNGSETIEEVIEGCSIGDKCKSCHEEGYENDGFSIAMALSLVKQKRV